MKEELPECLRPITEEQRRNTRTRVHPDDYGENARTPYLRERVPGGFRKPQKENDQFG